MSKNVFDICVVLKWIILNSIAVYYYSKLPKIFALPTVLAIVFDAWLTFKLVQDD